jgi:predicted ATPase/class 3 adenylate cyclase/DNA-binding CsgD family transcriptional regulator
VTNPLCITCSPRGVPLGEGDLAMGLPQGTVTFLFTDLEGSTRLWEAHPGEMREALARHDAIVRGAVESHDGVVFSTMGDGMAAVFASAREAVRAVLAAQVELAAEDWGEVTGPLAARMGLLTDEGVLGGEHYLNQPLNRCARLMAAGHGGQALVSGATELLVRDDLPEGCALVDLGEHRLRDLARPVRIFQLTGPGLRAEFPPLRTLEAFAGNLPIQRQRSRPGNLPVELTSFVGRARELAEIKRLLPATRVVTLTGPGGIGKSRLALRAAHKLGRYFPQGVWLAELAGLDDPDLLPYALARSLGVHERPDVGIQDGLVAYLRARRLLLVLDNCEHLLEACRELVAALVAGCAGVRILCTSRERLGVPGEATVVLSALELPAIDARLPVAGLAEVEALRLLVDRAVAVAPDFALTDENCGAAGDICRRLDGLPLAIELAAVRLASMTADDLLERLDDRFRLLAADRRVRPGRSQALRATVDWSHELLGEQERILWRRLSVFAGSFSLGAVEAVCSGAGLERERIVDLIGRLVDSSILTMAHGGRHGRYRLLETVRLYGAERLCEAGEDGELQQRHAAWYAELISPGDRPWWGTPRQAEVLDVLDVEWTNVEAALEFCAGSPATAELGLQMAADLWLYWMVRGRYRAGRRHLGALLKMAPAPSATRAMALSAFGILVQATGDHEAALACYEQARRVSEQAGWHRELGYALSGLGVVRLRLGEPELADELLAAWRETMTGVDDPFGRAMGPYPFATAMAAAGRLADARLLALEGLHDSDQAGDKWARGLLNTVLGIVEWLSGDPQAAEATIKEAVRLQDRIGHRFGMATSLEGLAWVAGSSSRPERAALLLGASAALWDELGNALLPSWQAYHDGCEAAARAGLDEDRYRACWEEGYTLSRDRVAAAALEGTVPAARHAQAATTEDLFELSARELEVARLVADGLSNPAVASALFISVATVKTHVSHILVKLGLDSRVQLASWVAGHDPGPSAPARG